MQNDIQEGDVLTVTAPATVVSGQLIQVGNLTGVCCGDAASGAEVEILRKGCPRLPKATGFVPAAGDVAYFDFGSDNRLEETGVPVGFYTHAALTGDTKARSSPLVGSCVTGSGATTTGGASTAAAITGGAAATGAASTGAATSAGGAATGAAAGVADRSVDSTAMRVPTSTVTPSATSNSITTPAVGDGTSVSTLSVEISTIVSSA